MMREKVLVVPRSTLFAHGSFHNLISAEPSRPYLVSLEHDSFFMERREAENNPGYKQIIPYLVLVRGSDLFTVTRLAAQGEPRLHRKVSIGLGGHINPEDVSPGEPAWIAGLRRELAEEVILEGTWRHEFAGMLNDDRTPVGSVHLGLVYRVELLSGTASIRESDKMEGSFLSPPEVAGHYPDMESWSQIVFSSFWAEHLALPDAG